MQLAALQRIGDPAMIAESIAKLPEEFPLAGAGVRRSVCPGRYPVQIPTIHDSPIEVRAPPCGRCGGGP